MVPEVFQSSILQLVIWVLLSKASTKASQLGFRYLGHRSFFFQYGELRGVLLVGLAGSVHSHFSVPAGA